MSDWLSYRDTRNTKPGRSAIAHHIPHLSSVFSPSFKVVQDIQGKGEKRKDEAGGPVGPGEEGSADDPEEALPRHRGERG